MATILECTHKLDYLLKKSETKDDEYIGSVIQIPGITVSGSTPDEVTSKIKEATKHYLNDINFVHEKALRGELKPELVTASTGIIVKTIPFEVDCHQ